MYSSEEEWSTASSDQEVGPLGDESSGDDNGSQHHHLAENTPATARTLIDPWQQYKYENEVKVKKVLDDNNLVENIKTSIKYSSNLSSQRNYPSYMLGEHTGIFSRQLLKLWQDLTSCADW